MSHLIRHEHHEDKFDDFQSQLLLPKKLSQLGPGVTWHDPDGDGDDDLFISSGKGGALACYRNDGRDGFRRLDEVLFVAKSAYDQTTILGWWGPDSLNSLLIGSSNLEERQTKNSFITKYTIKDSQTRLQAKIDGDLSSTGPMAMADYDLDGDLDLFAGGRAVPNRYPEPASSRLYRNDNGNFTFDADNSSKLDRIGLVSGAVFSDIDADGDADLVLAVEWGPVMVFRNESGAFSNATEELGLSAYNGWWQGVTTGDLNEDGKLDIIATNWGLNSLYHNRFNTENPLEIYYSDFDKNGTIDIVESYYEPEMQKQVPERDLYWLQLAIPNIRYQVPDNATFSTASVQEIIGPRLKEAGKSQANTLAHTVFFNRGDRFEAVELPAEAQFAPAFYAGVADFDGDGHDDVFLSQNFFALQIEDSRADAGRGLWLRGDGSGNLFPVSGQESGVKVYGEQRGAALSDYDQDGRIDLAVSQNGASTKLYHNIGAKPGLRIRLAGNDGNRQGVGATIRLTYENGFGPAREVHLGSGYWSQDSRVQVMGVREAVKSIQVRWQGGKITKTVVPESARDVTIFFDGGLKVNF
ncbi:MAG: CRTAC1 family protein [bacterium]